MVLTFRYEDKSQGGTSFSCNLETHRCKAKNENGNHCKRKVSIGLPYCWYHLQRDAHVKIKDSRWGKGLFAWDPSNTNKKNDRIDKGKVVFRDGDNIGKYNGERVSASENTKRYGKKTGPYAVGHNKAGEGEDAACKRSFPSLVNHQQGKAQNSELVSHRENARRPWEAWIVATKNIKNGEEIFASYKQKGKGKSLYRFNEPNTSYSTKYTKYRKGRRNVRT